VWLATDAPEIGLVDELGGIDSAIADEAQSAGIDDYQVEYYG
jgi:ClpP class serine protease